MAISIVTIHPLLDFPPLFSVLNFLTASRTLLLASSSLTLYFSLYNFIQVSQVNK